MISSPVRLAAVVALLALPLPALAWDLDCKFSADRQGRLDTAGASRVEIFARAGDLTVRPATGTAVTASGRACASSQAFLDKTRLHVRREGEVIQVVVQVPDEMVGIGLMYASLDLAVQVPASLPVSITDSSGDMTLEGVRAVRVQDSSGDILARGLLADLEVEDSSGDIRIEDVQGQVRVNDSSGDVSIRGARGVHIPRDSSGDIRIERIAGNVTIDQDSSGDIEVSGVNGNFTLSADGSGQVRVTAVKGTTSLP